MKVLLEILNSEKTNLGKLELVKQLEDEIIRNGEIMKFNPSIRTLDSTFILGNILDVIKTACNINDPLSDENIAKALKKATSYGFDAAILKTDIQALQDRLLNEEA